LMSCFTLNVDLVDDVEGFGAGASIVDVEAVFSTAFFAEVPLR